MLKFAKTFVEYFNNFLQTPNMLKRIYELEEKADKMSSQMEYILEEYRKVVAPKDWRIELDETIEKIKGIPG